MNQKLQRSSCVYLPSVFDWQKALQMNPREVQSDGLKSVHIIETTPEGILFYSPFCVSIDRNVSSRFLREPPKRSFSRVDRFTNATWNFQIY
jgi:hypothetical protein